MQNKISIFFLTEPSGLVLFYYCISGPFKANLQGSISTKAQCMETQLMPNESLITDLQSMLRSLYVKLLLPDVICVTKCEHAPKCFSLNLLFLATSFSPLSQRNYP